MMYVITRDPKVPLRFVRVLNMAAGQAVMESNGATILAACDRHLSAFDVEQLTARAMVEKGLDK